MKRLISLLLTFCLCCAFALADDTAEYSDSVYSFRYPSSWTRATAKDGSLILAAPDNVSGILTFSLVTDMICFTGNETDDRALVEQMMSQYTVQSSSNLLLNGDYESISSGGLIGFRAFGTWGGSADAHMVFLSDGAAMIVFIFIGDMALAEEDAILGTVQTAERQDSSAGEAGMVRWQGNGFSVSYPEAYGCLEMNPGVVFMLRDGETVTDTIMVRTYSLDVDYSDDLAPLIASTYLPKSTKVEADPVMEQVGPYNAAVIRGNTDSGPIAFYIIGSGRTALGLIFIGNDAVGTADAIVSAASID